MTGQVYYLNRICMDCGKDFLAVIEEGSGKTLNCWYWGKLPSLRHTWFIRVNFDKWENPQSTRTMWQKWMKSYIPGYYFPDEVGDLTVKSIWKRWYLLLRRWLDRTQELEMWTCEECVEKEKLKDES